MRSKIPRWRFAVCGWNASTSGQRALRGFWLAEAVSTAVSSFPRANVVQVGRQSMNETKQTHENRPLHSSDHPSRDSAPSRAPGDEGGEDADSLTSVTSTSDSRSLGREVPPGTRVGRYILSDVLGKGAIGVVYKARDPELERDIAVKMMQFRDNKRRERGLREAQALAQLSRHPSVITVYDVGTFEDDYVFIAMELVEGQTLRAWLDEGPRTREQIVEIFAQAGDGLRAAHDAGMVHRDFKPDNVLVAGSGRALVLDFGLARALDLSGDSIDFGDSDPELHALESLGEVHCAATMPLGGNDSPGGEDGEDGQNAASNAAGNAVDSTKPEREPLLSSQSSGQLLLAKTITLAGGIVGTPAYMSPEQLLGIATGTHADQFSFSVALYEALYRDRPFAARGSKFADLRKAVLSGRVRPPPSDSRVPTRLRRILLRGLSRSPIDRYPSMDELLARLAPFARSRTKRLVAIAALVGLAVALVALTWSVTRAQHASDACTDGSIYWDEIWNPTVIEAGSQEFVATGRTHAADTWSRIVGIMDERKKQWVATHREVCERTHVHASQSDRLLDVRMSCLDSRLREVRAFITELTSEPDTALVDQAVQATAELSDIPWCRDVEKVAVPLPKDPAKRQLIADLQDRLHRVDALSFLGRHKDAFEIAEVAAKDAESIDYAPTQALAGLSYGSLLQVPKGDVKNAEKALMKAANLAALAEDDFLLARIYIRLLRVFATEAQGETVARFGDLAETAITRAGNPPILRATLCETRAITLAMQGKAKESMTDYDCAIAAYAEAGDPNKMRLASILTQTAYSHLIPGRYELAWERVERAHTLIEKAVGLHHPWRASGLTVMAAVLFRRGMLEEAKQRSQEALAIYTDVHGPQSMSVASQRALLARLDARLGNLDKASALAEMAWQFVDKTYPATSRHRNRFLAALGDIAVAQGDYKQAIEKYQRSVDSARKSYGPTHMRYVRELLPLAAAHRLSGDSATADRYADEAVAGLEAGGATEHPIYVEALNDAAAARLARGDVAGARSAVDKALAYPFPDRASIGERGESHALDAEILWRDPSAHGDALAAADRALEILATAEGVAFQERRAQLETWLDEQRRETQGH